MTLNNKRLDKIKMVSETRYHFLFVEVCIITLFPAI